MGRKKTPLSDSLAVKASIVDAAEALFRSVGYSKTTVGEIAKALGMSQANVYRYFPTKASINEVICERVVLRIEDRCKSIIDSTSSAQQRLSLFMLEYFRAVKDNVIKEQRVHEMVVKAVEQYWTVIQEHVNRMDIMVQGILSNGIKAGAFKEVDIPATSLALQNAFSAFTYPALVERQIADAANSGGEKRIEADLLNLAAIVLRGISA
ncbi:TetR/AcrR family transcriptional regulator [Fundidesulfovibrio terrae]|uniref:TetR/AcrR family transcriptional regulator n=1 Tax=Fundidesulfovibrio terrae TaxID=2922866 RepID=UPI001FAFD788|nr:TetR/AcrR family transcriptional regulator [Fundidesulfovibrio terrae]